MVITFPKHSPPCMEPTGAIRDALDALGVDWSWRRARPPERPGYTPARAAVPEADPPIEAAAEVVPDDEWYALDVPVDLDDDAVASLQAAFDAWTPPTLEELQAAAEAQQAERQKRDVAQAAFFDALVRGDKDPAATAATAVSAHVARAGASKAR